MQDLAPATPRRQRMDLTLGVFSFEGAWRVYSPFEAVAVYPTRAEAVVAAEARAFAEASRGRRVEFFVESEDGGLSQIDPTPAEAPPSV